MARNNILKRVNGRLSVGSASMLLASTALTGTLLGIYRTKLINSNFNQFSSGAYFAAFKIPDFVFFTLASGALGVAFIPVLSDKLSKGNKKSAWELSSSILNFIALLSLVISVLLIIFARPLLKYVVAGGFSDEQLDVAVAIMRLVSVNPFLFSISTILTSVQQTVGRFFFFAIAPLFYNGCIILSIYLFKDKYGIVGIGLGVAIGAVLQLLVVTLGMINMNFKYQFKISLRNNDFKGVMKAVPARSIDQGIDYINSIAETRIASGISYSALPSYENALILHNAPISLIGIAVGTAAFPRFTERISQGRPDLFRKEFMHVLRTVIWISAPVVIISYFSRGYLARLIFARDNREIAVIFGFLVMAIFFRTLNVIISRYFYAQKDAKTPLIISLFTIPANIFLATILSKDSVYGVAGLAIAQSLIATAECTILCAIMFGRDRQLISKHFVTQLLKILSISGFTIIIGYLMVSILPLMTTDRGLTIVTKLGAIAITTSLAYLMLSVLIGIADVKPVLARIIKIIQKPIKI